MTSHIRFTLCLVVLALACSARAAYVLPKMGGGQSMGSMIHADVSFDGTNLSVHLDDSYGVPHLRPLTPPDEFDPAAAWSVLIGKAYNYQYAFNPGGVWSPPAGTWVWVERLEASEGLECFLRPNQYNPAVHGPTWPAILGSDGARWKWSGGMQHNAFAVLNPTVSSYFARYRVYLGDENTGVPTPGYGSDIVTFTLTATPVPEPALCGMLLLPAILLHRRRLD